jgi:hypothetical protein
MLPEPFHTEVPHDLGHDATWLGCDGMQALLRLRRHQPTDEVTEASADRPSLARPPLPPLNRACETRSRSRLRHSRH